MCGYLHIFVIIMFKFPDDCGQIFSLKTFCPSVGDLPSRCFALDVDDLPVISFAPMLIYPHIANIPACSANIKDVCILVC